MREAWLRLVRSAAAGLLLLWGLECLAQVSVVFVDQRGEPLASAVVVNPSGPQINPNAVSDEPAVMDQVNKRFVPLVLAVEQGRQVVFPNSDNIRHHVYSFSEAKRFEIKLYANKPKGPELFDQAGLVVLGCNIHDSMIGYIFVSQWQEFAVSADDGRAVLPVQGPRPDKLLVWHPWQQGDNHPREINIEDWPEQQPYRIVVDVTRPKPRIKRYRR